MGHFEQAQLNCVVAVRSMALRLATVSMIRTARPIVGWFLPAVREVEGVERTVCRDAHLAAMSALGGKRTLPRTGLSGDAVSVDGFWNLFDPFRVEC